MILIAAPKPMLQLPARCASSAIPTRPIGPNQKVFRFATLAQLRAEVHLSMSKVWTGSQVSV